MKQELLDLIKKDYEDYKRMIDTNFSEEDEKMITPGRLKRVERIREKHSRWVNSEDIDIYDCILNEAVDTNLKGKDIISTNEILMYISELTYGTYEKLFKDDYELPKEDENAVYILYMDIENNCKYFIPKEFQKKFEETHNIIVPYKNENVNPGANYSRNIGLIKSVRNEFIKEAMYSSQEEASKEFIKKYQETK